MACENFLDTYRLQAICATPEIVLDNVDDSDKYVYPWLGPEYSNGTINFETHFQDYDIENPAAVAAVLLQGARNELSDWWTRVVDGIWAELGNVSQSLKEKRGDCECHM
jgi:hypothetical protein